MAKTNKKSFIHWVLVFFNVIAALGLLISYTSAWINPSVFWPVAFIGLAYPFILLINLIFVLIWALRLRWVALISLFSIAVGYQVHPKIIALRISNEHTFNEDSSLKMMTYNAHSFRPFQTNKYDKKSKHAMLQMILDEEADIICFQEFYTRKKGEYNIKDSLMKLGNYKYFKYQSFDSIENEMMSQAIFSKYKIINYHKLAFYEEPHANMCTYADIIINADTFRLLNIHLQSISFQPEDYSYLNKVTSEVEPDLKSSKRIGSRLKSAFIRRATQAEKVKDLIDDSPYKVIIAGDFNDTPNSYAFNVISNGLISAFEEKGSGLGITYGGAFPNFQIDHILCSPQIEILDYKVIKKKYSDHYPVVVVLKP